jgi:DNA ligase-1
MRNIIDLLTTLDGPADSKVKEVTLNAYISKTGEEDLVFAIAILGGKSFPSLISLQVLKKAILSELNIPEWLFDESQKTVGNLTETLALLAHGKQSDKTCSLSEFMSIYKEVEDISKDQIAERVVTQLLPLDIRARKVMVKLFCGSYRFQWPLKDLAHLLASRYYADPHDVYQNMNAVWSPWESTVHDLCKKASNKVSPIPMVSPSVKHGEELDNDKKRWKVEYLWKGIRVHVIVKNGEVFFWTKDEEQIASFFPEFHGLLLESGHSMVLDAILIPSEEMDGMSLTRRVGRKKTNNAIIKKHPVKMVVFDILNLNGKDFRYHTIIERKSILETLMEEFISTDLIVYSSFLGSRDILRAKDNPDRFRKKHIQGLIYKSPTSKYLPEIISGWEELPFEPESLLCVLLYAERGEDGQHSLLTLAIQKEDAWIPLVKLPSNLDDAQQKELDEWVMANTVERFGPVRQVKPELVFEIQYNQIVLAPKRKSGVELPDAKIIGWKKELSVEDVLKTFHLALP